MNGIRAKLAVWCLCLFALAITALPVRSADRVLVVTTDWFTGSISTLPTSPPWSGENDLTPIHSDAVARVHNGLIYVVNRYGADNIQVIDPDSDFQIIREFSVGSGTNPHDIALVSSSRAFVSRYETNDLLMVNPQTGEVLDTISLAEFADEDELCEMHRLHIDDGFLYVQIQRLDRDLALWPPVPPSYLAVVDLATNELVDVDPLSPGMQGIELTGLNPIAPMQIDWNTGDLLVPEAGQYAEIDDGGIERVDLEQWVSNGMMITETELGGDLVDFALWSADKAYAVVSDAAYNTKLLSFDPTGGIPPEVLYNPGGYVLGDLLTHGSDYLFVVDRYYIDPGVRVYNAETGALVAGPLDTGLPPFELIVLPDELSDVADLAAVDFLGCPFPNPAQAVVRLHWSGSATQPVLLEVFDLHGRLVDSRDLVQSPLAGYLEWYGRDRTGRECASGVYLVRVTTQSGRRASRSVRILR